MMNRTQPPADRDGREPGDEARQPRFGLSRTLIWLLLMMAAFTFLAGLWGNRGGSSPQINYSTFREQVTSGNVSKVTMTGDKIEGELRQPAAFQVEASQSISYTRFTTYVPSVGDNELLPLLENKGVTLRTEPDSGVSWTDLLFTFLPLLLLVGFGYMMFSGMRSQGQNIFSFARSRARRYEHKEEHTTFDDVAGSRGAKDELREIVSYLKSPGHFQRLGAEIPRGVLLVGPPGTGKTLLARAVAGEAGAPFFSITGSDFMEMFVGVGASRVRSMFEEAKKVAPSIIFIDELDSIGRRRGAGLGGGHDEREQTLNQLLSEMDGFEPNQNVIVMAATNRPDILDSALLRPGRFDRRVTVDLPTLQDRIDILKIHARNKPLAKDIDMREVARGTPGFSGADLENLLNEAALMAARKNKDVIEREDVEEARDKVLLGLTRDSLVLSQEEIKLLAYHEGGHAILAAVLPNADPIHKVTIVPRGRAMGVTQQLPEGDKYIYRREYLVDRLAVMMGGRAAEELVLHTSTSGAESDLKQATQLARRMVLDWGMSKRLGPIALGDDHGEVFLGEDLGRMREYSDETAHNVDQEVKAILTQAFDEATGTLTQYREALDRLAEKLIEHEELPGEEVLKLVGKPPVLPKEPPGPSYEPTENGAGTGI